MDPSNISSFIFITSLYSRNVSTKKNIVAWVDSYILNQVV